MHDQERRIMIQNFMENITFYKEQIKHAKKKIQWLMKQDKKGKSLS